jgi:hypothetical protein
MISHAEELRALMVDNQPAPMSDALAARRPSRIVFVVIWVVLHSVLLTVLGGSGLALPVIGLIVLPVSYALVLGWYRPTAGTWGCNVVVGGVVWTAVAGMVQANSLLAFAVFGLITGLTTLLLLPWRGRRTASWPLINLLGASAAGWVVALPMGDETPAFIARHLIAGALYGLITGPALAFFLRDDPPAPDAIKVPNDQPTP